jgi:serine/threonine-protein kinase RsbW/stage II sporulation protein AB (anti-sigma F factor)
VSASPVDVRVCLPAAPESLAEIRGAAVEAARTAGADAGLQRAVALSVSEAASNAVLHAYRDSDAVGDVRLSVTVDDQARLCVSVADDGMGMEPRSDSPGLGMGLPLIARLADDLQVVTDRGTTVIMRFALPGRR